jgi:hypothetical protein
MLGKVKMLQRRSKQGGLFLTPDLRVRDDPADAPSDDYDRVVLKKLMYFQPIEDLVTTLDTAASNAVAS